MDNRYNRGRMFERDAEPMYALMKGINYIGEIANGLESDRFLFFTEGTQIEFGKLLYQMREMNGSFVDREGLIKKCHKAVDEFGMELLRNDPEYYAEHRTPIAELQTYLAMLPNRVEKKN